MNSIVYVSHAETEYVGAKRRTNNRVGQMDRTLFHLIVKIFLFLPDWQCAIYLRYAQTLSTPSQLAVQSAFPRGLTPILEIAFSCAPCKAKAGPVRSDKTS